MPSPRENGFNYGDGWGRDKPAVYYKAMELADQVRKEAAEKNRESWELDHALWFLRNVAETEEERAKAVRDLVMLLYLHSKKATTKKSTAKV